MQRRPELHTQQLSPTLSPSDNFPYPEIQQRLPHRPMATPVVINPTSPAIDSHRFVEPASSSSPQLLSKPRLSLNTASCTPRTLGRGNTGLRLDVLSADSPTSRNTYKNTYDESKAIAVSQAQSKHDTHSATPSSPKPPTPHPLNAGVSSSRRSSESSTSSTDSSPDTRDVPYTLPSHTRSILTNSRLPKRARTTVSSASTPKVFFPPVKRVCFRQPLVEEVQNSTYKLRHSDILELNQGSEDATEQEDEAASDVDSHGKEPLQEEGVALAPTEPEVSSKAYEDEDSEDSDNAAYPKTPIAGRRKGVRDWSWTLGPVDKTSDDDDDEAAKRRVKLDEG